MQRMLKPMSTVEIEIGDSVASTKKRESGWLASGLYLLIPVHSAKVSAGGAHPCPFASQQLRPSQSRETDSFKQELVLSAPRCSCAGVVGVTQA